MPVDPVSIASAGLGTVVGLAQAAINAKKVKKEKKEQQRLFGLRKAFQTPEEVIKNVEAAEFNAGQGYSDQAMGFIRDQSGAGLASELGTAKMLGANPNELGGSLARYYQQILGAEAQSDLQRMQNFDKFTNATQLLAQNKEAEWASQENIVKDQLATSGGRLEKAGVGINSGLNFATQSLTNLALASLYAPPKPLDPLGSPAGDALSARVAGYTATPPQTVTRGAGTIGTVLPPPVLPKPVLRFP